MALLQGLLQTTSYCLQIGGARQLWGLSRATKALLLGLPQATKGFHEQGFLEGLPRATKVFLCGLLQATIQAKGAADNLLLLGDNRQLVLLPLF